MKYSKELKLTIIKRYLKRESASVLASEYEMSETGEDKIRLLVHKYEAVLEKDLILFLKTKHIQLSKENVISFVTDYVTSLITS